MSDFFSGSRHGIDVIAHRGGKGEAPEETLVAFANAKQLGVDVLEMDIRVTSDGELVLIFEVIRFVVSSRWGTGDYRPNVAAIETSSKSIDRRLVETAKKHGLKLHAFTVNEVDDMKRLIALGVDGIITDFPTRLLELLSSRTPSSS